MLTGHVALYCFRPTDMYLMDSPVETLARVIAHAKYAGLSYVHYEEWAGRTPDAAKTALYKPATRNPNEREFCVVAMFPQTWGSTALGHGGIGGSAMTTAYTVVIQARHEQSREVLVYFGDQFAYRIGSPNQVFWQDLGQQNLAALDECNKYEGQRR